MHGSLSKIIVAGIIVIIAAGAAARWLNQTESNTISLSSASATAPVLIAPTSTASAASSSKAIHPTSSPPAAVLQPAPQLVKPPATPAPAPAPVPSSSPASTTESSSDAIPAAATIMESPNVGLLCHYKINDAGLRAAYAYGEDSDGELLAKGSGVVVDPQGYILTAKHIVDPQWTNIAYGSSTPPDEVQLNDELTFDYCDVGVPPDQAAPSTALLQSINPSIAIPNPFPYIATIAFDPPQDEMSDLEYDNLDVAVLKITAPMKDCQTFNLCTLPPSFAYSPVLYTSAPYASSAPNFLIDFGYPAESINSYGGSFTDFYLKGAVGRMTNYFDGDQYFNNVPLAFQWQANDVLPGRSGSPIYWQGYVIGIEVSGEVGNSTMDDAVAMSAIQKELAANGFGNILRTQ